MCMLFINAYFAASSHNPLQEEGDVAFSFSSCPLTPSAEDDVSDAPLAGVLSVRSDHAYCRPARSNSQPTKAAAITRSSRRFDCSVFCTTATI